MDYASIAFPIPWALLLQALGFCPPDLLSALRISHACSPPLDVTSVRVHPETFCVSAAARTRPVRPGKYLVPCCCPPLPAAASSVSSNPLSKHPSGGEPWSCVHKFPRLSWLGLHGPLFWSTCVPGSMFTSREVRAASEKAEDDGDGFREHTPGLLTCRWPLTIAAPS